MFNYAANSNSCSWETSDKILASTDFANSLESTEIVFTIVFDTYLQV